MRKLVVAIAAAWIAAQADLARAADPTGRWLDESGNGHVEIYRCSETRPISDAELLEWMCKKAKSNAPLLCARVASITEAGKAELIKEGKKASEVLNKPVLCLRPPTSTEPRWTGGVYSVYLDVRADAYVSLEGTEKLLVKGCKLFESRWTCEEETWTRAP